MGLPKRIETEMTQLEQAKKGKITSQMRKVAHKEGLDPDALRTKVAQGRIVIPYNQHHQPKEICGIGEGLSTKVNANIGTSTACPKIDHELKKLNIALRAGADTVMDLSTGGDIQQARRRILRSSPVPVGTVPIYEAAIKAKREKGAISKMREKDLLEVIEQHARDGVDFLTLHCGVTTESLARLEREKRVTDIVSRGGAILAVWMSENKKENPLYTHFDRVLEIAKSYDVTLSLGDGMRPGCLADATDRTQIQELVLLGELAQRAREKGVQVMIEGPGHVPLDQIQANVVLEKRLCNGAPFYVLGPLVTDVALGYDHITAAIGAATAAAAGADFICYVTCSEHLRLPTVEDVKEGVIAARIAAHAADIAKGINKARQWDRELSRARKSRDWRKQIELSLDPERAQYIRRRSSSRRHDVCTMCSEYCALKLMERTRSKLGKR